MSEYWKSTPKYWCKHCTTYVKDTKFERQQHEATGRHQGNLKRFLRGIQNDHEKGQREKERAKSEIERLNKAVGGGSSPSPALHVASQSSKVISSTPASIADRKRQMVQLAAMGVAVPDEGPGNTAIPGDWQVVSQKSLQPSEVITDGPKLSLGVRKRKIESDDAEDLPGGSTTRGGGWGSTIKRLPSNPNPELDVLFSKGIDLQKNTILAQQPINNSLDDKPPPDHLPDPEPQNWVQAKRETNEPDIQGLMDKIPAHEEDTKDGVAEDQQIVFKKRKSKKVSRKGDT